MGREQTLNQSLIKKKSIGGKTPQGFSPINEGDDIPLTVVKSNGPETTRDTRIKSSPALIKTNFIYMCCCFSITHGCVNSLIPLASAQLGETLGGIQTGILNFLYGFSALTMSSALIAVFGTKWALAISLTFYVPYVACFLLLSLVPAVTWPAALLGATIGGFAAGFLWAAQGVYYAEVVKVYIAASGEEKQKAGNDIGLIFATIYCGGELITRILSSFLFGYGGFLTVAIVFTILSSSGAFGLWFIRDFGNEVKILNGLEGVKAKGCCDPETQKKLFNSEKLMGAINLYLYDPQMKFLFMGPVTFACSSAVLNLYLAAEVIPESVGEQWIGYLGMGISGGATIFSAIFARLANYTGKEPIYVFGQFTWFFMALYFLTHSDQALGNLPTLFMLFSMHGMARATYETTTKAIFADIWNNERQRNFAFANLIIGNGLGAAFFNLVFPYLTKIVIGYMFLFVALSGMIGLILLGYVATTRHLKGTITGLKETAKEQGVVLEEEDDGEKDIPMGH